MKLKDPNTELFASIRKHIHPNKYVEISEATFKKLKLIGEITEVFINPTKMEMNSAGPRGLVRFTAFGKSKKLYVWRPDVTHGIVLNAIGVNEDEEPSFSGTARRIPNSAVWEFDDSDRAWAIGNFSRNEHAFGIAKNILETDWQWLDKYFDLNNKWQDTMNKLEKSYDTKAPTIKNKVREIKSKKY
jgi:hypothetical protein